MNGYGEDTCHKFYTRNSREQVHKISIYAPNNSIKNDVSTIVTRLNNLLGPFKIAGLEMFVTENEYSLFCNYGFGQITIGIKDQIDPSQLTTNIGHEFGHGVVDQYMKISFNGRRDTFWAHRNRLKEQIADADSRSDYSTSRKLELWEERLDAEFYATGYYQELVGDILAVYLSKDPHAMKNALLKGWRNLPELKKEEFLSEDSSVLKIMDFRSFTNLPNPRDLLIPSTFDPEMDYRGLNLTKPYIWSVIEKLPEKDLPAFILALIKTIEEHYQKYQRNSDISFKINSNWKYFERFNRSFIEIFISHLNASKELPKR